MSEEKRKQVIALGQLGWPLRRIEEATGVRRETAAGYLRAAGIAVRPPRGWGRKPAAKPANEVITDCGGSHPAAEASDPANPANLRLTVEVTADSGAEIPVNAVVSGGSDVRHPAASFCEPWREVIEVALSRGRNAMAIWQDLVDHHGFTGAYESVKRYVRKLRGATPAEACGVIITAPGEEAQVDYGAGPMVRDPQTGKYRRALLFVMTLGWSRKSVRLLVFRSSSQTWAELHERAFRRLGGSPRVVVLDNLREGVLKPDIYDPSLNPLYRDVLAHYGAVAMPCRVQDPDRKGKVEAGVGHTKRTPLKGMRYESLEQAQTELDGWEERWADTRIHGTTKRQVATMFSEEKPTLLPLPLEPFRYYKYGERGVNRDGCVEVEAAYYSVPPGWIGRRVQVQWDNERVRMLDPHTGQLLREHLRQARGRHRIHEQDQPKRTPLTTVQLLARADKTGVHVGALCRALYDKDGPPTIRRIQGILSFTRKYGPARVDEACATALEFHVIDYRFVRRCLERAAQLPLSLRQVDPLIRELTTYRDVIQQRTKESDDEHQ